MSDDPARPLHVKVAEALGCKPYYDTSGVLGIGWKCGCSDEEHRDEEEGIHTLARYDTDWSATGPLVEKYGISLACTARDKDGRWLFGYADLDSTEGPGTTPLIAVCGLLLALKEAGKLLPPDQP